MNVHALVDRDLENLFLGQLVPVAGGALLVIAIHEHLGRRVYRLGRSGHRIWFCPYLESLGIDYPKRGPREHVFARVAHAQENVR